MRYSEIDKLADEPAVAAEVRNERGAPRLFVNGKETYPLFAWSWGLVKSTSHFKQAGVHLLHPVLGMNAAWPEPARFDWHGFDGLFDHLLAQNPAAYFLPRILLDAPEWWKDRHPDELIQCALPPRPEDERMYRPPRRSEEGGWMWGIQLREPSYASTVWRADMEKLFRAFLQHVEQSPLRSRLLGYQVGGGIYGEWHYFCSEFLPDLSQPMQRKLGYVPDLEARLHTGFGLFRDPAQEHAVIDYYRRFHEEIGADSVLHFARIAKEETGGRALCGAFNCYLLENVWIQEGGHLAPEKILASPDIDFIASPYSYQTTNVEERQWWEHEVFDEAGNWLGRTRGVAGDGGYRVLLESLRRHGKLYFVELDATTYLEPAPVNPDGSGGSDVEKELCMIGGVGCTNKEGTQRILARDLGQVFVRGNGGWLFDFGPVMRTGNSWYADEPIIAKVREFVELGACRPQLDLSSCAQIAAVYDAKSLFVTRHWRAEAPFTKGGHNMDFFSRWFLDSQARAFHRIGAPMDFLYRFDLEPADAQRYRLFFMVNLFYLTSEESAKLKALFENSNATVVWYCAPGFVTPDKLDLSQMEMLTGFRFALIEKLGPMLIRCSLDEAGDRVDLTFGTQKPQHPRFAVTDKSATALGHWTDNGEVAFASKTLAGWHSIYVGTAPLPAVLLRRIAERAGAALWSSQADIVMATQDTAMIVATADGMRELALPKPLAITETNRYKRTHYLDMAEGDVHVLVSQAAGNNHTC